MIVLACDLDNTLIHSHTGDDSRAEQPHTQGSAADSPRTYPHSQVGAPPDVCVEYLDNKPLCFMSSDAYALFKALGNAVSLVPVTARSVAQYQRVSLFTECAPRFAVTSCGATILKDGEADAAWQEVTKARVQAAASEMADVFTRLKHDKRLPLVRLVDESFIFARGDKADEAFRSLPQQAYAGKLSLFQQGKKIYAIPCGIDKGAALDAVRKQFPRDSLLIAAGDSELDLPCLNRADFALVPSEHLAALVHAAHVLVQKGDFAASILRFAGLVSSTLKAPLLFTKGLKMQQF